MKTLRTVAKLLGLAVVLFALSLGYKFFGNKHTTSTSTDDGLFVGKANADAPPGSAGTGGSEGTGGSGGSDSAAYSP